MNPDIAFDRPRKPRRNSQGWPIAALITGIVLILARVIVPSVPGVVFKGSIDEVHGICTSAFGALAQASNQAAAHGCSEADTAMVVLNVLAIAGLVMIALGGWALLRSRQPSTTGR